MTYAGSLPPPPLPRTEEKLIRDQVNFRVGPIVYLGVSRDETSMGFAFPRQERDALASDRRTST
jgi:hypothetical protein